jgi:hypothetical protein
LLPLPLLLLLLLQVSPPMDATTPLTFVVLLLLFAVPW